MPDITTLKECFSFTPSTLLELWALDGTNIGLSSVFYFVNGSNTNYTSITVGGQAYAPFPIKIEGMEADGKSTLPRPKLTVSNINGFVSALLLSSQSTLEGAIVTRTRIHARFIDASNFPAGQPLPVWVTPNPSATYAPEPYEINRLITETPDVVQWELRSPIEMQNAKLPRNQVIGNVCTYKYRQPGTCNWSGAPISDKLNHTFTGFYGMTLNDRGIYDGTATYNRGDYVSIYPNIPQFSNIPAVWVCAVNGIIGVPPSSTDSRWIADYCVHNVAGCKLRYTDVPLRTSSFPGVTRAGWIARTK